MGNVRREDRADGTEIKKLNHLGLGLRAIGRRVGCHAATVKDRLETMRVEPTDTRRNFMEDIYDSLSKEEREWLADGLYNSGMSIKEFISGMIKEAFKNAPTAPTAAPTPLPKMEVMPELTPAVLQVAMEEVVTHGTVALNVKPDEVTLTPVKSLFSGE